MVEPLAVDPARLGAAGSQLAGLVFPAPPPPLAAGGGDVVSAAINETMPDIESLVSDGLPGVKAALTRTASSMTNAADIYAKADQSLGEALTQFQFGSGDQASAAAAGAGQSAARHLSAPAGAAAQLGEAVAPQVAELTPRVAATVPQLVQLAPHAGQFAQQASPIVQTISQTAQQAGSQGGGAMPAQLAADTTMDQPAQSARLVDDTTPVDEGSTDDEGGVADEAAAGDGALGSAPIDDAAGGSAPAGPLTVPIV
ncbi:hypothetical protein [Mycobacterium spongiae]|uniref:Uncharacterized protein n=1 Tax=Mycobacterium spongiae TaxID=886343 RepID=A0A975K151_9MYCO|nr:hypothetical protein [Mycobacterium spongiae]QUR69435.1 hypothetical protein F6B93_22265 [Mycobacterium spongiae]